MTTSESTSFPNRLSKIDPLTLGKYPYLNEDDECYYFGDYTSRAGYGYGPTNQFIFNFKCHPSKRNNRNAWRYKQQAISQAATQISQNLGELLGKLTLVPIPSSKTTSHPEFDNRVMEMLNKIQSPAGVAKDIRELVVQSIDRVAMHELETRPSLVDIEAVYSLNEDLCLPVPSWICIVDDVLTTGCSFRATSNILKRKFPNVRIIGLFLARTVHIAN